MSLKRFGLFSYTDTHNLGDEIQSIAARQFLPRVDYYLDREHLSTFFPPKGESVALIMNAWYSHHPENWPPSENVVPLLIAMHITQAPSYRSGLSATEFMLKGPAASYLKALGPVGARDLPTLELLQQHGIESYFSGCMTLTLSRPSDAERDENLVVANELPAEALAFVEKQTRKTIDRTSHGFSRNGVRERFEAAEALLNTYARASCVITTRLHCALPCVAMGTPVLLLDTQPDQYRFDGLNQFCHHSSVEDFVSGRFSYDVDSPPANPVAHLPYRAALISRAKGFVEGFLSADQQATYPLSPVEQVQTLSLANSKLAEFAIRQSERVTDLERRLQRLERKLAG